MEKIKAGYKNLSLKKSLIITNVSFLVMAFGGTILILLITRPSYYALVVENPENPAIYWHDLFSILVVGIYICVVLTIGAYIFYSQKLSTPLKELVDGIERISMNDLNFSISYDSEDEFGMLCNSFERMKAELQSNYKKIWRMTEERKKLNASFAHDLRTPLTVLKGYTDFLEEYILCSDKTDEKLLETNSMMAYYIKRIEEYVEVMNTITKLEDTPVNIQSVSANRFMEMLNENVKLVGKEYGKDISVINEVNLQEINGDIYIIFRVLENVIKNACQYSKEVVYVHLYEKNSFLFFEIIDDGVGFSLENLAHALEPFYTSEQSESLHWGLGLNICKILCENHGGNISISNIPDLGAKVQFSFLLGK